MTRSQGVFNVFQCSSLRFANIVQVDQMNAYCFGTLREVLIDAFY